MYWGCRRRSDLFAITSNNHAIAGEISLHLNSYFPTKNFTSKRYHHISVRNERRQGGGVWAAGPMQNGLNVRRCTATGRDHQPWLCRTRVRAMLIRLLPLWANRFTFPRYLFMVHRTASHLVHQLACSVSPHRLSRRDTPPPWIIPPRRYAHSCWLILR